MGSDFETLWDDKPQKKVSPAYYLDLDGITGDSVHKNYKDHILISAFRLKQSRERGDTPEDQSTNDKDSSPATQDMDFTAPMSSASPKLGQYSAFGKHVKSATLTMLDSASKEVISTIELTDVFISGYTMHGDAEGHVYDYFTLNFRKIEFRFSGPKPDGSKGKPTTGGYDAGKIVK